MATLDDLFQTEGVPAALALSRVGNGVTAYGDVMGAVSHFQFGQQARAAAEYQAAQLRANAGQAQAASQRQAEDVGRQTQLVTSRALAVAGASGAGASDPGVVSLMANYAAEGAYKKAVALYGGDERARAMNAMADAKEYEGANTAFNSDQVAGSQLFAATTTLMKGKAREASLQQRFGAGMPGTEGF